MQDKGEFLIRPTLEKAILNSIGSPMFRNLYVKYTSGIRDVVDNGRFACAMYVTWLLCPVGLLDTGRATVESAVPALRKYGWIVIDPSTVQFCDVLVWDVNAQRKTQANQHIGFSLGADRACSIGTPSGVPEIHHFTYNGARPILIALTNMKLKQQY
jgi:hypothetical protein